MKRIRNESATLNPQRWEVELSAGICSVPSQTPVPVSSFLCLNTARQVPRTASSTDAVAGVGGIPARLAIKARKISCTKAFSQGGAAQVSMLIRSKASLGRVHRHSN